MPKPTIKPHKGTNPAPSVENDALECSRIRNELCGLLKKMGGYEPAVDDFYVDQIAESRIALKKAGIFLKSQTATEFTFTRVTDVKAKFTKIIGDAYDRLGISRRSRLADRDKTEAVAVVKNSMLEAMRIAESNQ
ncbi:MAG TPA: hypothetical protein VJZ32_11910 [Candidatus Bathyarchaeia archaeon]|nr:hypothetical protein [Candidatus Bathyarchaeia archaeon]